MSVAKKEEVRSHPLILRFDEPAVGVPIKKRPVSGSDRPVPSGLPFSISPSSPATEMSVSAAGAGCGKESFFNIAKSDANVITKGKGIINSQIQDHGNRSFTTLFNGSSEIPSAENERSFPPVDASQRQKFLALDLQLASRNGKHNCGPVVKEEKVDQSFSDFSSAQHHKNVEISSEINASSNSSFGRLPNLDLNVPLDPADSLEGLPAMHESGSGLFLHHQKAQVPLATPVTTVSSGLGRNIDNTLNLSNSCGISHKCAPADVTLDLQLKPPARPELGVNWKGLAPAPELSLSLFGKPMDDANDLSASNGIVNSEPAGSSTKFSEEADTPRSDKSPVEKTAKLVPCNANPQNTMSSTVSGIDKMVSNSLVKKEPEEPSRQHILNDAEKAHLLEQQSGELVNSCTESEKTESAPQVPGKTGLDLNSDIFPNNSIHNGLNVVTDDVPKAASLPDVLSTETMPIVPEVDKSVKCEPTRAPPSPAAGTAIGHVSPLMASKSLPLESNVGSPAVGLCESFSQPSISSLEPSCSDTVCKPAASRPHSLEDTTRRPCDANEASDALRSASNSKAEPLVLNSQDHVATDGMSQGSAEMDCSEDDDNTVSRLPNAAKPHGVSLGHGPTTKDGINANSLCKQIKKEHDSDTQKDCSSLTSKVCMEGVDDGKCVKAKGCIVSHSGEQGHQSEVSVSEESKDQHSLKSSPNNADNSVHDGTATRSSSTDPPSSSALQISISPKMEPARQSPKTLGNCLEKTTRSPVVKSERSLSPHGKRTGSCSEDHAKNAAVKKEHRTGSQEVARQSDLQSRDSVPCEGSELDGSSSSQPRSECGKVKSGSEKLENDKSKPDSCKTSSVQNERDGQLGSHWRDLGYAYVNRNERWERFMQSEREKNKGEYHGGKHASDMINQRRADHRFGGRGAGSCGHPRSFRGPRMSNEFEATFADEPISGRRRPFEDDLGHLHRIPHRRRRSPLSGCLMREMEIDGFHGRKIPDHRLLPHGQIEDLQDDMMEERFFVQHSHRHHTHGDHEFIHRQRSHSPVQRRGVPVHFHRGRSPEVMHRSPPLVRDEGTFLRHRRHNRRHRSPLDEIGHDERGMQRNTRRCGMIGSHHTLEGDAFEPPLHPAHLAELHAEEVLTDRRKYGERRAYLRSLEGAAVGEEEEMLAYHEEEDMDFAEAGGPREHDGRFRNRLGHRARGEQEDGYRHRGPQGWRERDGDSNGSKPKKRRKHAAA